MRCHLPRTTTQSAIQRAVKSQGAFSPRTDSRPRWETKCRELGICWDQEMLKEPFPGTYDECALPLLAKEPVRCVLCVLLVPSLIARSLLRVWLLLRTCVCVWSCACLCVCGRLCFAAGTRKCAFSSGS